MYRQSFLYEKATIGQHTSLEKNICEPDEKKYGNLDSHAFTINFVSIYVNFH